MEGESYILKAFIDPMINTDLVSKEKPTVMEFLKRVRKEATKIYDGNIDEECKLVVDDTRYSIAVVFVDGDERYLLVGRQPGEEDSADLEGFDFPIASHGVLPDSSSKVNNVLDQTRIKNIDFIGMAREKRVEMPCYEALIDYESIEDAAQNNGYLLTVDEVLKLDDKRCSSKVKALKKHLLDI